MNNRTVQMVLLIIAVIFLVFAAFSFEPFAKLAIGWLGTAFFAASFLL